MSNQQVFKGRHAALLTRHSKEKVIAPVIEGATGCSVLVESSYDTDLFGTFTLDIARPASQMDTARLKAKKGMELLNADLGLASEGSFGPHPFSPFIPWNREVVILIDSLNNIEIYGEYAGCETNFNQVNIKSFTEAEAFARKIGFPEHFLIVSPHCGKTEFIKGINTWEQLNEAVAWGMNKSSDGYAVLQTDMRAHANPTRMANIKKAAENLVLKISQKCPQCGMIGFSVVDYKRGLPCEWCGFPTDEIQAEIYKCQRCSFIKETAVGKDKADPGRCGFCNP